MLFGSGNTGSGPPTPVSAGVSGGGGSCTPNRLRVMVIGDTSVGKTLLLQRLAQATCPAAAVGADNASTGGGGGTTAVNVESVVWREYSGSPTAGQRSALIDFVELSGNRSLGTAARRAFYDSKAICAVLYLHDASNAQSAAALQDWHEELESCGVDRVPFFVVGTQLGSIADGTITSSGFEEFGLGAAPLKRKTSMRTDSFFSTARFQECGFAFTKVLHRAREKVPTPLLMLWVRMQYWVLIFTAFVLFGWSFSVSSSLQPKPGRKVLQELLEHHRCQGFVEALPLLSLAEFNEERVELNAFLNTVVFGAPRL